jgi:uncharacterized protein YgiM (DUF1202 family)
MKRILTIVAILIISQMACSLETQIAPEPADLTCPGGQCQGEEAGSAAPPAASLLTTGETPEPPENGGSPENAAGAVYELPTTSPLCATVTAIVSLHLRAERSERSAVTAYLYNGEQVTVLNPAGQWWKIRTTTGRTGYANSRYLQEEKCQQSR